jgi:hypothetical protein
LADTAVAITAGSGTNIDTRTEATNGNHRQVIVIGDPSTNAGVAPVDSTLGLSVQVTNANANGQAVMASSAPVVIASNQSTLPVGLVPVTSGGLTIKSVLIASGTNATSVKASAGQLYKVEITNNSANIAYLKIYNTAGTPTAGSGTPVIRLMVPGNASGAGAFSTYTNGIAFATGIGFTFTGGIADADTTSVAASAFIVNLYYA